MEVDLHWCAVWWPGVRWENDLGFSKKRREMTLWGSLKQSRQCRIYRWGFPVRHGGTPMTLVGLFHGKSLEIWMMDWGTRMTMETSICIHMFDEDLWQCLRIGTRQSNGL